MSNLWINNLNEDTSPYETCCSSVKELFVMLQKEYGKCISKMYSDTDKGTIQTGYVFSKGNPMYIGSETWIEVYASYEEGKTQWAYTIEQGQVTLVKTRKTTITFPFKHKKG